MAPSLIASTPEQSTLPETQETKTPIANPITDQSIYASEHQRFKTEGLPNSTETWLKRAREAREILAKDAAARDIENKSPVAEISLLKSAGLLKVLGPVQYGGGGQTWEVGYRIIREVSKGDGSIGMLCEYSEILSV